MLTRQSWSSLTSLLIRRTQNLGIPRNLSFSRMEDVKARSKCWWDTGTLTRLCLWRNLWRIPRCFVPCWKAEPYPSLKITWGKTCLAVPVKKSLASLFDEINALKSSWNLQKLQTPKRGRLSLFSLQKINLTHSSEEDEEYLFASLTNRNISNKLMKMTHPTLEWVVSIKC